MRKLATRIGMLLVVPVCLQAGFDVQMDAFSERLAMSSADGAFRIQLAGTVEVEGYAFGGKPPGLIRSTNDWLLNPRLVTFLDLQAGPDVYGFAQARLDRGFDPADNGARVRLDEFALRYTPSRDGYLSLQIGQFATVVGKWVQRHLSWQNAFVTAPLLYENPTRLTDLYPPYSEYSLSYAGGGSGYYYNPIIWGPSYATGLAASGKLSVFEWSVEVKNAALMSRPEFWPAWEKGFRKPTVSGRIEWQPDLRWAVGLSASEGSWAGTSRSFDDKRDYRQRLWLVDVSYAYRHLQIWLEYAHSTYSVPGFENELRTAAWFVEARYKLSPRVSMALRWNQQEFSDLYLYGREIGYWGEDMERLDMSLTVRLNAHVQVQVEVDHYPGNPLQLDKTLVAMRLTLRY